MMTTVMGMGDLATSLQDQPADVVDTVRDALVADFTRLHDGVGVPLAGAITVVTGRR